MRTFKVNAQYKSEKFGENITIYERTRGLICYKDDEGRHGNSVVLRDKDGNEKANIFNNMDIINA